MLSLVTGNPIFIIYNGCGFLLYVGNIYHSRLLGLAHYNYYIRDSKNTEQPIKA